MSFWQSPTVQSVAKQTLAAGAAGLSMGGFFKVLRHVSGTSNAQSKDHLASLDILKESDLAILTQDFSLLELMDRLSEFQPLAKKDQCEVLHRAVKLVMAKVDFQKKLDSDTYKSKAHKVRFSDAKDLRVKSQFFIEAIRGMRNLLELKRPDVLEAFDEVAADCQTWHTELSADALSDAQLSV